MSVSIAIKVSIQPQAPTHMKKMRRELMSPVVKTAFSAIGVVGLSQQGVLAGVVETIGMPGGRTT
jgi:hypothetical protein